MSAPITMAGRTVERRSPGQSVPVISASRWRRSSSSHPRRKRKKGNRRTANQKKETPRIRARKMLHRQERRKRTKRRKRKSPKNSRNRKRRRGDQGRSGNAEKDPQGNNRSPRRDGGDHEQR